MPGFWILEYQLVLHYVPKLSFMHYSQDHYQNSLIILEVILYYLQCMTTLLEYYNENHKFTVEVYQSLFNDPLMNLDSLLASFLSL